MSTRFVRPCLLACLLFLLPPLAISAGQERNLQDAVARINGHPLTGAELEREIRISKQKRSMVITKGSWNIQETLRKESLDRLIAFELLFQISERAGVSVDDVEVERYYRENEAAFQTWMEETGSTPAAERLYIRKNLVVNKYIDTVVTDSISITEEELKQHYEKDKQQFFEPEAARMRLILVRKGEDPAKALAKIQEARDLITGGKAFAVVAGQYSEENNAAQGGLLPEFINRGQLGPPFDEAIFSLAEGQTSPVLETERSYHLVQVVEKKPRRYLPYEEARGAIYTQLKALKQKNRIHELVDREKESATIILY